MGGGSWSSTLYNSATTARVKSGKAHFGYHEDVASGKATGIHESLDPKTMVDGRRESRDSDEHPESIPVVVLFDVTGSMGGIPRVLQSKIASVMDVIIDKAGVAHPQILVGAIGDNHSDRYPLQVGQFESDNRFDEQLRNIILEGGGGGGAHESYELAYRFAADHTVTDAFEKRGKKGYLFTMGDEAPYQTLEGQFVKSVFGVDAEDETVQSLLERAQEKWDVYHLFSVDGSYPKDDRVHGAWRDLLGERFVKVEDSALVAEVISGLIHMMETTYDIGKVIDDIGVTGDARIVVENALVPLSGSLTAAKGSGRLPATHSIDTSG